MANDASTQRRQGLGAVSCLSLGLFLLSIGAALGASALGENGVVVGSVPVALVLELPTLTLVTLWAETHGARPGWIVITLIAAAGIVVTWLAYPLPGICDLVHICEEDPRLLPAVIGTIVIAGLWAMGTVLRVLSTPGRPSRPWSRLADIVVVVAVVFAPAVTLWEGGFSIPWW